jgi:preprotein translocase subunit SecE
MKNPCIPMVGGKEMQRLIGFLRDTVREMKKVSWPKRKELTRYTIIVMTTVTLVSLFFAVIDLGISELIRVILE